MKKFDYVIAAVVLVMVVILGLAHAGKNKFSKSPVEAVEKISFEILLKGVATTKKGELIKKDDETFLTIRNVPYKKLKVFSAKSERKKVVLPLIGSKKKTMLAEDVSLPHQYDILVTVTDEAKITADGAVVGGNKIKIGIPIVLEGFDYKLNGTVSNLSILKD